MPVPGADEVVVRVLYLSVDPGQRTWMRAEGSYMPPFPLGKPMRGGILGQIVSSAVSGITPGSLVSGMGEWAEFCLLSKRELRPIPLNQHVDPVTYMAALGPTGWTAYFGMTVIGRPQEGDTLVVSAAAGAVGSVAGQIGKIFGCRVIGIAGGSDKCRWLRDELGFDGAIDYRAQDLGAEIERLCPRGVDIYFENVGGAIGAAVYPRMAVHGRIALCGLVSEYQGSGTVTTLSLSDLLMKRVSVGAFVITDYFPRVGEALKDLGQWHAEGRLKFHVETVDGLGSALDALNDLLTPGSAHRGKLLVRVAEPSSNHRSDV